MKVLIIDDVHPILIELLEANNFEVTYKPEINRQECISIIHEFEVLVVRTKFQIDREVIDAGINLKLIARAGAGMDNVDEKYAQEKNIFCVNAAEGNRDAVAEHAIGLLLNLFRNINKSDRELRSGIWEREGNRGIELKGKTIGLIGYGNTGKAFAKKLSGFEASVIAYDKYLSNYSDAYATETALNTIYQQADIISLHIPLTSETSHFVNDEFLIDLPNNVFLINTSRGKIISTSSLLKGLKAGKILGAALDVLENEQFNTYSDIEQKCFNELITMPNVILSAHIAGWTYESYQKISKTLFDKIFSCFNKL